MTLMNKFKKFIISPFATAFFIAMAIDPSPAQALQDLYDNLFFRFIFIFLTVLQYTKSFRYSLFFAMGIVIFFYFLDSKEEKRATLENNFRKKDFLTFGKIVLFMGTMYYFYKR